MFDQGKADEVIERICAGESLRKIAENPLMPKPCQVVRWAAENPDFEKQYARAMIVRSELAVDRLNDIGEAVLAGKLTPEQARVAADLIKWPASKLMPKKYGDRLQTENDTTLRVEISDPAKLLRK